MFFYVLCSSLFPKLKLKYADINLVSLLKNWWSQFTGKHHIYLRSPRHSPISMILHDGVLLVLYMVDDDSQEEQGRGGREGDTPAFSIPETILSCSVT